MKKLILLSILIAVIVIYFTGCAYVPVGGYGYAPAYPVYAQYYNPYGYAYPYGCGSYGGWGWGWGWGWGGCYRGGYYGGGYGGGCYHGGYGGGSAYVSGTTYRGGTYSASFHR
jgi:hypothetical protein